MLRPCHTLWSVSTCFIQNCKVLSWVLGIEEDGKFLSSLSLLMVKGEKGLPGNIIVPWGT